MQALHAPIAMDQKEQVDAPSVQAWAQVTAFYALMIHYKNNIKKA